MSLAENIRKLRRQKQWTQPELATKTGISKGYVYMLEAGEMTNPSLEMLMKIADAFDVTVADLIGQARVVAKEGPTDIPESLAEFARQRKKSRQPLLEEDLLSLARTQFRGRRPETVEDWAYVYEFLKRTLGEGG